MLSEKNILYNGSMTKKAERTVDIKLAGRLRLAINSMGRGGKTRIAELCGVSSQAVNGWITTGYINRENIVIVAKITNYDLNWLMTGKGSPIEDDGEVTPGRNPTRLYLDTILSACDLAMRHSGRDFTDAEKLDIYLEGIEFAGRKKFSEDLVKQYLCEVMKKSKM